MTDVAKNVAAMLLMDKGLACAKFQDRALRDLNCKKIRCDGFWSFCYAKQKNVFDDRQCEFGFGDLCTWVAIDLETKLVVCWLVSLHNSEWAKVFMNDVARRLASRVQIAVVGLKAYLEGVDKSFGADVDCATLVKLYGAETLPQARHSPPKCIGCRTRKVNGKPEWENIPTSIMERQNLTIRMGLRRFTRLTNVFSEKVENLGHAIALHFMYYNFVRQHRSLRVSPAMAAGVTDRLRSMEDIVRLIEEKEAKKPN